MEGKAMLLRVALFLGFLTFVFGDQSAEAEQPATRADLAAGDWVHYATVERSDGSFRRIYLSRNSLPTVRPTEDLPDGSVIAMETFYGPGQRGQTFLQEKQDGRWIYGSFSPGRPDFTTRARPSCRNCHRSASERDNVFTLPSLWRFSTTQQMDRFTCDRGGRSPCDSDVYERRYSQ